MRRSIGVAAVALGARALGAQARDTVRLSPLLEIGAARSLPATLADRSVSSASYGESVRLRLDGQWGLIAEGRLPLGARRVWGVEAYAARFHGGGRATAVKQVVTGVAGAVLHDTLDQRLTGVTSWRATLGVARAVPLPAGLTGALLVGGTWGRVTSPAQACTAASCPFVVDFAPCTGACTPKLDLTTPGVTLGADAFTREWRGLRLRFAVKGDVLRVDEAAVRRSLRWYQLDSAPLGAGGPRWHVLPSATVGVEFRIPL